MKELFSELQDLTKEEIGISKEKTSAPDSRRFWLVEVWFEKRDIFKEFVADIVFFGVFLGSLDVFHRLITRTSLDPEQILLLNKTHFYLGYFGLLIFGLAFIITIVRLLFAGKKNDR
jgi:hypothetical protein